MHACRKRRCSEKVSGLRLRITDLQCARFKGQLSEREWFRGYVFDIIYTYNNNIIICVSYIRAARGTYKIIMLVHLRMRTNEAIT